MGTIRSMRSLISAKGRRSISLRSMSSIILASGSSFSWTAVTFGEGMLLSTWASMSSLHMFRTCGVFALLGRYLFTRGKMYLDP